MATVNTGEFNKTIVTTVGKEMIAKSQGGQNLQITRVVLGDGVLGPDENPVAFTAVKSQKLSVNIADFTDQQNGLYTIQFRMSNADVDTGFWFRELGVMAKIDNGEEQLYAYTTASGDGSFVYDKTTPVQERVYDIDFGIGDAENVSIVINSSIIYITQEKFESEMAKHNNSDTAHESAFTAKFKAHNADTAAHKDFVGATADKAGVLGMVPAPPAGAQNNILTGGKVWSLIEELNVALGTIAAPTADTAALKTLLGGMAYVLKAITGESDWKGNPKINLATLFSLVGNLSSGSDVVWDGQKFTNAKLGVSGLMAQNGYINMGPNYGSLIIQWGMNSKDVATITFPIAFTILAFGVTPPGTIALGSQFHLAGGGIGIFNLTNISFLSHGTGFWIAIGR